MNILAITKLFPTLFSNNTGIFNEIFYDNLSGNFNDISINLIRPIPHFKDKGLVNGEKTNHPYFLNKNGYNVYYPRILSFGKFLTSSHHINYYHKLRRFISKKDIEFDVIHSHWLYPDGYVSVKLGHFFRKPVIVHCHGSDVNFLLEFKSIRKYNDYTLRNCDKIIAVSKALKERILTIYPDMEGRIEVIYNGLNFSAYSGLNIEESSNRLGIDNRYINFVFVGNVIKSKGIDDIIEAAKIISKIRKDFRIYIIGKGQDEYINECKLRINEYELQQNVVFTGEKPHEEIKHWHLIARASLLPSYSEGFPMVILESLAVNTPVIAANVGGIPEIIENGINGILIEPERPEQLASAILEYLNMPFKPEIKNADLTRFDQKNQLEKTVGIYKDLMIGKQK